MKLVFNLNLLPFYSKGNNFSSSSYSSSWILSFRYVEFFHFLAFREDLSIRCFDKLLINKLEFYVRIMQHYVCVYVGRVWVVIVCVVKRTFKAEANNLNRQTIEHLHYCIRLCFLLCLI